MEVVTNQFHLERSSLIFGAALQEINHIEVGFVAASDFTERPEQVEEDTGKTIEEWRADEVSAESALSRRPQPTSILNHFSGNSYCFVDPRTARRWATSFANASRRMAT